MGDEFESGFLGELEIIAEGLFPPLPGDAVAGLDFLIGELDGEGDDEQMFRGIGDRGNRDIPDVKFPFRCEDAGYLVEDLGAGFGGQVHEGEEGGNRVEGVIEEVEVSGIHNEF